MAGFRDWLVSVLGRQATPSLPAAERLHAAARPSLIYAIGDVHGCLDALRDLERRIVADAAGMAGEKWLVMLGDYIDRGPASAQVLDHLLMPPPTGFRRICLRGNHEETMLAALAGGADLRRWLSFGGDATLASYGVPASRIADLAAGRGRPAQNQQLLAAHVPDEHIALLGGLPILLSVPDYVFVHAGLRPGVPVAAQRDADLTWIRYEFLDVEHDFGSVVVHGHTPVDEPFIGPHRIGIDTGCYASGVLTGLRIAEDGVRVLQ